MMVAGGLSRVMCVGRDVGGETEREGTGMIGLLGPSLV